MVGSINIFFWNSKKKQRQLCYLLFQILPGPPLGKFSLYDNTFLEVLNNWRSLTKIETVNTPIFSRDPPLKGWTHEKMESENDTVIFNQESYKPNLLTFSLFDFFF
jgi:hypothetical protein